MFAAGQLLPVTTMTNSFNDSPISLPDHDRFGFDPLARALARSIVNIGS